MSEDVIRARDNQDDSEPLFDGRHDARMARNRLLPPRGPKSVRIEKAGVGIRIIVTDWSRASVVTSGTSTTQFLVYWAETVDQTTLAGVAAGFARATLLSPAIPTAGNRMNRANLPLVGFYNDPKYQTGYFFIVGQNAEGEQSAAGTPIKVVSGTGGTIPFDVEHFQASESGEQHGQTTISVVSYSFRVPTLGGEIDRVQFMYLNYPNVNEFSEGESRRVTAGRGATQTGDLKFPIGRRIGSGTITITGGTNVTGIGTNFLEVAAAAGADQLEVFGFQARIFGVTSNTSMTLVASWLGPDVTAVADWQVIASVTIYAVSEGVNGARRDDPENTTAQETLDFDGLLSAPIAPTLTSTTIGNAIRLVITPGAGTELARALLYRLTGTGSFDKATWQMIHAFAIDNSNPAPEFQWDDSDFTVYEREQGQVFSYAATVVNVRDQEGPESNIEEAACKLDAPGDNSPTTPAREIALNQLWNGHINGTVGGAVAAGDAAQDGNMGGAAPAGRRRWVGAITGVGVAPGHVSTTEVVLAMSGAAANGKSILYQDVDAWDHATAANRRLPTNKLLCLQVKGRTSGGQPNGILRLTVEQYNGGALTATCGYVQRLSDDSIDSSATSLAINGSDILTDHQIYWGIFVPDANAVTTNFRALIQYEVTNWNGVNVFVTEADLSLAEVLTHYTPQMADPSITYDRPTGGAPLPPPAFDPDDGTGKPFIEPRIP